MNEWLLIWQKQNDLENAKKKNSGDENVVSINFGTLSHE